jgi:hypothetical protein
VWVPPRCPQARQASKQRVALAPLHPLGRTVRAIVPREQIAVHLSQELGDLHEGTTGYALSVERCCPVGGWVGVHSATSHRRCRYPGIGQGCAGIAPPVPVKFEPPRCDHCEAPSILQIITVVFEGASPPDRFLCRAHAPLGPNAGNPPSAGPTDVEVPFN